MKHSSLLGRVGGGSTGQIAGYETPKVFDIGAITYLTLGASGNGFDHTQAGMVPGDDYILNPNDPTP